MVNNLSQYTFESFRHVYKVTTWWIKEQDLLIIFYTMLTFMGITRIIDSHPTNGGLDSTVDLLNHWF